MFASAKKLEEVQNEVEVLRAQIDRQSEFITAQGEAISGLLDRVQELEAPKSRPTHFSNMRRAPETK